MESQASSFLSSLKEKLTLKGSIKNQEASWKNILTRALIAKKETGKVDVLKLLLEGGEVLKQRFGQWEIALTKHGYEIHNHTETGSKRFYSIVPGAYDNPFRISEPDLSFDLPTQLHYVDAVRIDANSKLPLTLNPDKDLAYSVKNIRTGQVESRKQKISGIICKDGDKDVLRFSLSNAAFIESNSEAIKELKNEQFLNAKNEPTLVYWRRTVDGIETVQMIEGQQVRRRWYLDQISLGDKNRQGNVDAIYTLTKPDSVIVGELANANFRKPAPNQE